MDVVITFLEGVVTFVSPCLLPLLPVYLAFFAGGSKGRHGLRHTIVCALGFVLGFTIPFTILGASAGAIGAALLQFRQAVNVTCGTVMGALGLNYAGVLNIAALNRTRRRGLAKGSRGFVSSVVFGMVFAVGWSPCVGAFLASALGLAASAANVSTGTGLLLSYSAGLGVPFVLSAVLVNQLEGAFRWIKRHYDAINKACGLLLVIEGVLMAFGLFGA